MFDDWEECMFEALIEYCFRTDIVFKTLIYDKGDEYSDDERELSTEEYKDCMYGYYSTPTEQKKIMTSFFMHMIKNTKKMIYRKDESNTIYPYQRYEEP